MSSSPEGSRNINLANCPSLPTVRTHVRRPHGPVASHPEPNANPSGMRGREAKNRAITTGNSALYGRKQDQGAVTTGSILATYVGEGTALYHGHSDPAGIDR